MIKRFIEERTGMLYGTYRWSGPNSRNEPPPIFGIALRPANPDWVRFEAIVLGHAFYVTWGWQA